MARSSLGGMVLSALVAAAVAGAVSWHFAPRGAAGVQAADSQPAYERVMKTKTLRCSYFTWRPFFWKDPVSGEYHGLNYDQIVKMTKILGWKLEITGEVPFSSLAQDLKAGRNDTVCGTFWPSGSRAQVFDFTMATDYLGAYAVVRADDKRFDGDLSRLNSPDITLAMLDGNYDQDIIAEDFPKAKTYSNSQDSDGGQLLTALAGGKADAAFVDTFLMHEFEKSNPGKIRKVEGVPPVRIWGDSFVVNKGETKLRDMFNVALEQMNQSGDLRRILDKYMGDYKGQYFYPAQPYEK